MNEDPTSISTQPARGNWVTVACIAALLVLSVFVVVMMIVGSKYPPPAPEAPPGITIDTSADEPEPASAEPETQAESGTDGEATAEPPNPSAE
jgi:hypothetical protein